MIQRTVSGRLLATGVALIILLVVVVIWGFHVRIKQKEERKHAAQEHVAAGDAAVSNRPQVRGGQTDGPNSQPASTLAEPSPTVTPVVAHIPANQPAPTPYYAPSYVPPYDAEAGRQSPAETIKAQELAHQYERHQAALEAPTGATSKAQSQPQVAPQDPYQAEVDRIRSLAGQVGPSGAPQANQQAMEDDPNGQEQKRKFNSEPADTDDYMKTTRIAPLSRWIVEKGEVIPAGLPNKVVSDLPGDLIAMVKRDVYDTPTHRYVMIPAGSLLAGEYNSSVSYGQNRVQIAWTYLRFPDGSYVDLARFPGHSADGSAGLKDQVDNHYKRLIGGVALSSLFAAGLQISQNHANGGAGGVLAYPSNAQIASAAIAQQAATVGQQITSKNLNIQPTIKIRPGDNFEIFVKKNIVFPGPYQPTEIK
jgi:type IV secretion system protein VirB10